ncbi:uncharacterized protein PG986_013727 [Apiospora aurea]|uniref:protein S-acyltransferase n=1 Tax=Apiospora aurea TaxID=335848 RepID=A0ABR1PWF7_9PEZI
MQLLELPLDVFRLVIRNLVRDQGGQSMKSRAVCRAFANEVLDALITTRVIEEIVEADETALERLRPNFDIIARYLHHRVRTDRCDNSHPWILTISETSELLAKSMASLGEHVPSDRIEASACLCLAVNAGDGVFKALLRLKNHDRSYAKEHLQGGTRENSLAVAAWMGKSKLIESLLVGDVFALGAQTDPDPLSLFGRPSWAAAVSGNVDLFEFFLKRGAKPFEPTFKWNRRLILGDSPLGAAAYMGHDSIVRLILGEVPPPQCGKGSQNHTEQESLEQLDFTLVIYSCKRGAPDTTRVLLEYGAHPNETDNKPRSCLQLAARSGDTATVKVLLDAGAHLGAPQYKQHRTRPEHDGYRRGIMSPRARRADALEEARKRNYPDIVWLLEERKREIEQSQEEGSSSLPWPLTATEKKWRSRMTQGDDGVYRLVSHCWP